MSTSMEQGGASWVSPTEEYNRWLAEGGLVSPDILRKLFRVIRNDTKGRSDGSGRFRGSLIGGECDRQQALSYLGAPQSATDLKYAVGGTWSHLRWQAAGLTSGWLTSIETRVRLGTWFKGTADGIMSDGRIFELKTTRSTLLGRLNEPKPMHLDQITLYMAASMRPTAVIVYEGRDSMATKEFNVTIDWDRYDRIVARTKATKALADKGLLPDMHPDCRPGSVLREYCSFRDHCLHKYVEEFRESEQHHRGV